MPTNHHPETPETPAPPTPGHAPVDTSIALVVRFGIALAIVCVVVLFAIAFLHRGLSGHYASQDKPGFFSDQRPAPPLPHLQVNPTIDLQEMHRHENQVLHSYGWVDRQHGVVHIPIDQAMSRYLSEQAQTQPGGAP